MLTPAPIRTRRIGTPKYYHNADLCEGCFAGGCKHSQRPQNEEFPVQPTINELRNPYKGWVTNVFHTSSPRLENPENFLPPYEQMSFEPRNSSDSSFSNVPDDFSHDEMVTRLGELQISTGSSPLLTTPATMYSNGGYYQPNTYRQPQVYMQPSVDHRIHNSVSYVVQQAYRIPPQGHSNLASNISPNTVSDAVFLPCCMYYSAEQSQFVYLNVSAGETRQTAVPGSYLPSTDQINVASGSFEVSSQNNLLSDCNNNFLNGEKSH